MTNGPWEDYAAPTAPAPAPVSTSSPSDSQGPWNDYTNPSAQAPAPVGFNDVEKRQVRNYIPKAKGPDDLDKFARTLTQGRVGISNAKDVLDYYRDYKKVPTSFVENPLEPSKEPTPPATAGDYIISGAENLGRGFVHGLGFIDDAINPFPKIKQLLTGTPEGAGPGFFEKNAGDVYDSVVGVRKPKNALQKYTDATAQGIGGALIPMGELNGVRGVTGLIAAGAAGGIGSQAGADLFPNSPLAPLIGGLLGAHVGGTPFALKPIRDNGYVNDNGGMQPSTFDPTGTTGHPEASYIPPAAQALADKAADVAPNGLTPKGRGKLTVTQINRVAEQPLLGMSADMNRLVATGNLDAEQARTLKLAIQNRDGITKPEIDDLRGTPEGDAVAEGLMHYRAVQGLTKPYGGDGRGVVAKAWNYTLPKVLPKVIGDLVTIKPGDVNAARIRGADKAIDRLPVYQRLADRTGPTNTGPALDTFQQRVADTFEQQRQAKADSAAEQAQAAADAKAKDDAKAARYGMTDSQFGNYSSRSASAQDALNNPPAPAPRSAKAQSALNKYQKAADTSSSKLDQFDQDLNAPTPAPKRSPEDLAISNNMDQGLKGYHRMYADTISSHLGVQVQPADVAKALKQIDASDVDPFQLRKFEMEHKVSPAAKAALLPRIENVLRQDKGVMDRKAPPPAPSPTPAAAKAPTAVRKTPQSSNKPKSAASSQPAPDESGNYREIMRPVPYAESKSRHQDAFDNQRAKVAADPDFKEMSAIASDGLDHIKNGEKTTESAMRYFDDHVGPQLREHFQPDEIEAFRQKVEHMATVGKPYRTDADLQRYAKKP